MFDITPHSASKTLNLTVESAIAEVKRWDDLPQSRRRHLVSALSSTAKLLRLPPASVPLTPAALRASLLNGSASAYGLKEGTMRNILSGLRFVLRRLEVIDRADSPLSPAWAGLLDKLPELKRGGLIGFARYCSVAGLEPYQVSDHSIDTFVTWLELRTLTVRPRKTAGEVRGAWNRAALSLESWPQIRLRPLRQIGQYILPLQEFPQSFRDDLDVFCARLGATALDPAFEDYDRDDLSKLVADKRACRATTVATRKGHARWAASALVATGVPVSDVTSLASLVTPVERARHILKFLHERAGRKPSAGAAHIGDVLRMIAKYHARLPDSAIGQVVKWAKVVKLPKAGMTEKNARHIRQMLEPRTEAVFYELPHALMEKARGLRDQAPAQAANLAMRATAIGLLTHIPLRLSNVIGLEIDIHLQRTSGRGGRINAVRIAAGETKNRRELDVPVSEKLSSHLQEWISDYRPIVSIPGCTHVFPGRRTATRPLTPQAFRDAVRDTMRRHTDVPLTPQQFRHLAARLFLREHPGHYEEVRQLLGHADIRMTIRAYCGTESDQAHERYQGLLEARRPVRTSLRSGKAATPKKLGKSQGDQP